MEKAEKRVALILHFFDYRSKTREHKPEFKIAKDYGNRDLYQRHVTDNDYELTEETSFENPTLMSNLNEHKDGKC